MKDKILIADYEKYLSRATKMILEFSGYDVDVAYNGQEALDLSKEKTYDCILLDIMMPVMDGIQALKQMRKANVDTPVILLTAKSTVDDKVEGLDSGANDYLTKPVNKKELLARIRAQIRTREEMEHKFRIGNIVFDKGEEEISSGKAVLHLSSEECDILEYLIKNQEKTIPEIDLQNRVWDEESAKEGIVPMYISYIQEKFNALDANVKIVDDNKEYKLEMLK